MTDNNPTYYIYSGGDSNILSDPFNVQCKKLPQIKIIFYLKLKCNGFSGYVLFDPITFRDFCHKFWFQETVQHSSSETGGRMRLDSCKKIQMWDRSLMTSRMEGEGWAIMWHKSIWHKCMTEGEGVKKCIKLHNGIWIPDRSSIWMVETLSVIEWSIFWMSVWKPVQKCMFYGWCCELTFTYDVT